MSLPVFAVERFDDERFGPLIKTSNVDIDAIGIGARDVKTFDAALTAEQMLGDAGVERVSLQTLGSRYQPERRFGYDEVKKSRLPAHRTVAVVCGDRRRGLDLKAHTTAVTPARVANFGQLAFPRAAYLPFCKRSNRSPIPGWRSGCPLSSCNRFCSET